MTDSSPPEEGSPAPRGFDALDVTRMYEVLRDPARSQELGESIVRALITDVLRSKLGFETGTTQPWNRGWERSTGWSDSWGRSSPAAQAQMSLEVSKVLQGFLAQVALSEEELSIVEALDIKLIDE